MHINLSSLIALAGGHLRTARGAPCGSCKHEYKGERGVAAKMWPHDEGNLPDQHPVRICPIDWIVQTTSGFLPRAAAKDRFLG
jgi:hypothetical protein